MTTTPTSDAFDEPPENASELLAHVGEQLRETVEALADETENVGPGWLARTRSLPQVWSLNKLQITEPVSIERIFELADQYQEDLTFRHIVVTDQATAADMAAAVVGATGWWTERDLYLALTAAPDREVDTSAVVELDEPEMLTLMRQWGVEEHFDVAGAAPEQLDEYNRREGRLWHERVLGFRNESGAAVAVTKARSRGRTGWVEDVYTVPEARRRGYARALVTKAIELAGASDPEVTFIIADDNDWPKHLYMKLGFRPIGHTWTFHRDASGRSR